MSAARKIKDPGALLDYPIDWAPWLDTDTITASTWVGPVGITIEFDTFSDTATVVWLSGGTVGDRYVLTNHITTAGGRQDDRSLIIDMVQK